MLDVRVVQNARWGAWRRAIALVFALIVGVTGWQHGFAARTGWASFKSFAVPPAVDAEFALDIATNKKTAAAKEVSEALEGPSLEIAAESQAPEAKDAKKQAKQASPTVQISKATAKSVPAVATATAVPAKTVSSSATNAAHGSEPTCCHPEAKPCPPRNDDEIWLVSTRCLGCPDCESATPDYGVWQYDLKAYRWNRSTLKAFFAAQTPSKTDVVWVHGYRIDAAEAEEQGLGVYEQLTAGAPGNHAIRLIVFSWAATSCGGIIEDTRMKAARTNSEGYYLGWLVNHIDPGVPVDFIGYSFGARIVTGSLELLAGGTLCGRTLADRVDHRAPMHSVIIAAALDDDWLAIGRPHGQALEVTDRMLALNNGCDRALKHYGIVDPCTRPEALGYTGAMGPLGENGRKLYEIDECCAVGKQHNWRGYFYNPSIVARIRPYVGLDDEGRLQTAERKVQNDR